MINDNFMTALFNQPVSPEAIDAIVEQCRNTANHTKSVWEQCITFCDATSLNITDSEESIRAFTRSLLNHKVKVAGICVAPVFVETVGVELEDAPINIVAVTGGFPLSQTFLEVKILETAMAVENGADEIDFVIDVAAVNNGAFEVAECEIREIISEVEENAVTKVILETGALKDYDTLRKAALTAMSAGADFVKTSTGKSATGATAEQVAVMCLAVKDYFAATGKRCGIKVAGGVRTPEDAALYYSIVQSVLGPQWLTPELFRIGASSLVEQLYKKAEE